MIEYNGKIWIEKSDDGLYRNVYKVASCHFPGEYFCQELFNFYYFTEKLIKFEIIQPGSEERKKLDELLSTVLKPPESRYIVKMPYIDAYNISDYESNDPNVLVQIGFIATIDALIGNFDRFPLLARSEGNLGNILVASNGKVYPIDGTCLNVNSELYHAKLENFIEQFFSEKSNQNKISLIDPSTSPGWGSLSDPWKRLANFIRTKTSIRVPEMEKLLKQGAIDAINRILSAKKDVEVDVEALPSEEFKAEVCNYQKMFTDTIKIIVSRNQ